jgi:hypothetical protein
MPFLIERCHLLPETVQILSIGFIIGSRENITLQNDNGGMTCDEKQEKGQKEVVEKI